MLILFKKKKENTETKTRAKVIVETLELKSTQELAIVNLGTYAAHCPLLQKLIPIFS